MGVVEDELPRVYDITSSTPSRRETPPDDAFRAAQAFVGNILGGKYRLEAVLGVGGMAFVYKATNEAVGRTVAIKMLQPRYAAQPAIVRRFLREAKASNLVQHPNVVSVFDIATDDSGSPFIVQEFLEGDNLFAYSQTKGGRLSVEELIEILVPIVDAVAAAHASDVIHRDIKPENVFLANQGGKRVPKLMDFGISKVRLRTDTDATQLGAVLGTPPYMAPELVHSAKDADPRSDVWAIGVTIFELLTGDYPFPGDTHGEVFQAILHKDPPVLSTYARNIPTAVSDLVAGCLRKDPNERYENGKVLSDALAVVVEKIENARRLREQRASTTGMTTTLASADDPSKPTPRTRPPEAGAPKELEKPAQARPFPTATVALIVVGIVVLIALYALK
jgi:serine/threonine-protein kinase